MRPIELETEQATQQMKSVPSLPLRAIIGVLAVTGLAGVLPVSWAELSTHTACPHLGPVPACHVVSVAYAVVLATSLHSRLWNTWVFLGAWLPLFLLAAAGSGLELAGHGTCPQTENGIPKCFLSLALATALIVPFVIHFARRQFNDAP